MDGASWQRSKGRRHRDLQYETDRAQFIGRGRETRNPGGGARLERTLGHGRSGARPVICMRRTVRIPPGTTARIIFTTIAADSREQVLEVADKYRDASHMSAR